MSLKCEEVRERFSGLWENELSPAEELEVRRHLEGCSECQTEFTRFDKTLRMVHSVEEVDVPEGFLPGIFEKIDDRKGKGLSPEKIRAQGVPLRWKLPVQAVAMVAIVFLALYFTKMMPDDSLRMKAAREAKPSSTLEEKEEKNVQEGVKVPVVKEEKLDGRLAEESSQKVAKKEVSDRPHERAQSEKPKRESKVVAAETAEPSAQAPQAAPASPAPPPSPALGGRRTAPSEAEREEKSLLAKKKDSLELVPSQEIVVKSSDQKKGISGVDELVKRFGGETLASEGNSLVVSLPNSSLSAFRRDLEGIGTPAKTEEAARQGAGTGRTRAEGAAKRGEVQEKDKEIRRLDAVKETIVVVRIILVEE
jgi:hypothetical protein